MEIEKVGIASLYRKHKSERDIFQELMPTKVKEVLLVATLYDSYSIVREGQFSDKIFGEYLQLNLYTAPRFTSVNTREEAIDIFRKNTFDLVIIMVGVDKKNPVNLAKELKQIDSEISILLLVNNNADLRFFQAEGKKFSFIERIFVWNGNSNVFLAMIKYIEDRKNLQSDTEKAGVRVILLVEDSIQYYSRYLPILYTNIMSQTQILVQENDIDELHKILKYRARPKVILVSTFEEATDIINKYRDYILTVISDVKFERNGIDDEESGVALLRYAASFLKYPVPLMLQSHDIANAQKAREIGAEFIDKNSESLSMDILNYLHRRLGFGNFIFKNPRGQPILEVKTMQEFQQGFSEIPAEVLLYHGKRNSFSTWLMARGEIKMAEQLRPIKTEDFDSSEKLREFCLNVFMNVKFERFRGRIVNFDPSLIGMNRFILRLSKGSLGGKGRGMAFMCHFIENIDYEKYLPGINFRIPVTAIIGTSEFDRFIENNNLYGNIYSQNNYESIRNQFLESNFDEKIRRRLRMVIDRTNKPLAIRSSGLFEDSLLQPFSGVYSTYLVSNNHPDPEVRYNQLITAIKLVYASIFTESAQSYFEAIRYKIEEEKMAVIIQEVVGHHHDGRFYPAISGVAQSYNYYPVSYMEPDDGFSVAAIGLGTYVVSGENAFRFCPKYPGLIATSLRDQIRDTQKFFYAIDLARPDFDLVTEGEDACIGRFSIRDAEKDGILENCASSYDAENDCLLPGVGQKGPKVIDFANILRYNTIPFADSLRLLLRLFKEAMGSPVEIEYAVDIKPGENNRPTFYLLQIKPLIRREAQVEIEIDKIHAGDIVLYTERGMGNGRIESISDVIYVDTHTFDRMKTKQMATEITEINKRMESEKRDYVLIGPGRWGSKDPFTGIPVQWANISRAKIIIEIGLRDFPLDASLGSHFFHNVTSMNVGYFSIDHRAGNSKFNMEIIANQKLVSRTEFIRHIRFKNPLQIVMDGRKRQALITCGDE